MPNNNILLKSFNLFFSKFQCLPTITFSPPTTIDDDEQPPKFAPTTTIAEPVLFNNFNSFHDATSDGGTSATQLSAANDFSSSFHGFDGGSCAESLPDFTSAVASHRFFFSSPGSSNSIFELPLPVPKAPPQMKEYSGGVAVLRYSADPYGDFRESMMEMIEARGLTELQVDEVDWEFLHELLFCYLTLNPKHAYNFIISAFVDVIISLLLPPDNDTCPKL